MKKKKNEMIFTFIQAITRVREVLKELETKESANKETVQILKQEFVEHKTTYEKVKRKEKTVVFEFIHFFFSSIYDKNY